MQQDENTIFNASLHYAEKYLQYASAIISSYDGKEPFHLFIKKYFSFNKKHGSKDRKLIGTLCYDYFRICHGVMPGNDLKEKILIGLFLCETKSSILLDFYKKDWNTAIGLPFKEKIVILKDEFNIDKIFPFADELSDQLNISSFRISFLQQPKVFIRIRPGYEQKVIHKLTANSIAFEKINENCLSLFSNKKISEVLAIDQEVVIQDYNSQKALDILKPSFSDVHGIINVWDCCAGSGGKSLLAYDTFKNIELTVSDTRKGILNNLRLRFDKAAIKNYTLTETDLQKSATNIPNNYFDVVIADVPCSGSGTWQRTPEQLHFFNKKEIEKYASLQKGITGNVINHMKDNSYLIYVTCSVFKKENEENIDFFQKEYKFELIQMQYLKGYETQADTLFAALLKKNN